MRTFAETGEVIKVCEFEQKWLQLQTCSSQTRDVETGSEPEERLDLNHFLASLKIIFLKFVDNALTQLFKVLLVFA